MGTIPERISRVRSRGSKSNKAIVSQQVYIYNRQLKKITKDFSKAKKRQVAKAGAAPVRTVAKRNTPKGSEIHYRYPKQTGSQKAAKFSRINDAIGYVPGNLRKGIGTLSWKRSADVFVGPRAPKVRAKPGDIMGLTTKTADPYYAAMVFGSQRAFMRIVLDRAAKQAKSKAIRKMAQKASSIINKINRKNKIR